MKPVKTHVKAVEYKGYSVYRNTKPILSKDMNFVDAQGVSVNDKKPIFWAHVQRKNKELPHLHVSMFGGNNREDESCFDEEYTKKQIDEYIEKRKESITEKFKNHRSGKIRVYNLNNVKITVIWEYATNGVIYVNQRSLRYVHLEKDFTFEDVLQNVYIKVISRYNTYDLKDIDIPKYITDRKEETIDMSILPLYEYIGYQVEFNNETFIIRHVHTAWYKDESHFRLETNLGDRYIKVSDIPLLKITGKVKGDIGILINKSHFYE